MPVPEEDNNSEYLRVPGKPTTKPTPKTTAPKPNPKTPKVEREPMPVPEESEYLRVPSKPNPKSAAKSVPKPATSSPWKELKTEDGYPYWFNEETQELFEVGFLFHNNPKV